MTTLNSPAMNILSSGTEDDVTNSSFHSAYDPADLGMCNISIK
jgi:hypothetical protein